MEIKVITPDSNVYEGEVVSAKFPGISGGFEVLKNHAAIISLLGDGELVLKSDRTEKTLNVKGGVVEVVRDHLVVLVEEAREQEK